MELRVFRYFLTVVQEGNISRAADILHVTQPTLSRQMAQLEEELGVSLFARGRHLALTEAGVLLRRRAEEVTHLVEKIEADFREQSDVTGTITIGIGAQGAATFVNDAMQSFRAKYPKVKYEFYTNNADYIKERLDQGLLDFGLLLEPVDIGKYDYIRLQTKERWGILMRTDCPLSAKPFVTKKDLQGLPLVTTSRVSLQQMLAHWFGQEFDQLNVFATYNIAIANIAKLVDSSVAYALILEGAVKLCEGKTLSFRPLYPELSMTSVVAWKKFNLAMGAAGKFAEYLQTMHLEHTWI